MAVDSISPERWLALEGAIVEALGLHYPPERRGELERGLRAAATELGFRSLARWEDALLAGPPDRESMRVLATHLTVGETYFFREPQAFHALGEQILPPLIEARRRAGRLQLRLWSAGCSSGEEPYSLAILLRELLPDLADWRITILATDINPRSLCRAEAAVYGEWSFRGTTAGLQERWFRRVGQRRLALAPEIRAMVTFRMLNLAKDAFPSASSGTEAMDVIFCRNVLMYFAPEGVRRVARQFAQSLVPGGCLVVSPSEATPELFAPLEAHTVSGCLLFRKRGGCQHGPETRNLRASGGMPALSPLTAAVSVPAMAPVSSAGDVPEFLQEAPAAADVAAVAAVAVAVDPAEAVAASTANVAPPAAAVRARAAADAGQLEEALYWCDRWLLADRLDAPAHYLRAMVLGERGDAGGARAALQRAVYLDPSMVVAHVALGRLAADAGRTAEARRHFTNALDQLDRMPPAMEVPESGGLTAARLAETLRLLAAREREHDA